MIALLQEGRGIFFFIMISFFAMLEWDLRMIQDKNANAVIALDSLQTATTFEPYKKKSRVRIGWNILTELLHAPNSGNPANLPQLPTKRRPVAELPPTAIHMIQRNPDLIRKRKKGHGYFI